MIAIPEDTVTPEDLAEWYKTKQQLDAIKAKEGLLRSRIFKFYFPTPKEGTNKCELKDGTGAEIKGTSVINRNVDPAALDALTRAQTEAREAFKANPATPPNIPFLPLQDLIKWKPEVAITEYRKLTDEEQLYFDQCLIIKPGSPQLEIVIPKRAKS